jgi:hypothetical protein
MDLAYAAGRAGGTMTGVLSAANEKAVELFIDEKYDSFLAISSLLCFLLDKYYVLDFIRWFGFGIYSANFKESYVIEGEPWRSGKAVALWPCVQVMETASYRNAWENCVLKTQGD